MKGTTPKAPLPSNPAKYWVFTRANERGRGEGGYLDGPFRIGTTPIIGWQNQPRISPAIHPPPPPALTSVEPTVKKPPRPRTGKVEETSEVANDDLQNWSEADTTTNTPRPTSPTPRRPHDQGSWAAPETRPSPRRGQDYNQPGPPHTEKTSLARHPTSNGPRARSQPPQLPHPSSSRTTSKYPTPSSQPIMGTEQSSQIWPTTKEPTLKRQRHRNTAGVAMRILHPRMRNHQEPRPAAFGTTVPVKQWGPYPAPQRHGRLGMKTMCPSPPDARNPLRERQPLSCIALQARSEASRRRIPAGAIRGDAGGGGGGKPRRRCYKYELSTNVSV